jgi:predicted O-linked N-acetylglucosamine transferase (SPINDLY family)
MLRLKRDFVMRKKSKRSRPTKVSSANNSSQVSNMNDWQEPEWIDRATKLVNQGDLDKAAELFTEELVQGHIAAASMPEKGFIMVACSRLLKRMLQINRAECMYRELLELSPKNIGILGELAKLLSQQGKLNEAVKYYYLAMEINPDEPEIWIHLSSNLIRLGQKEKGIELLKAAVEKMPNNNQAWSTLLCSMHYFQDIDRAEIFEMSRQWAGINAPANTEDKHFDNSLESDRKLRIGYISPDFREHSVIYLFEPLLDEHSRDVVEVYGYGNVAFTDKTTSRIASKFDHYRNVYALDDKSIADVIEKDGIDILVDMAGHMGDNALGVMSYKPAPIQVTWLGYPDTTGMSQVDYRLTDEIADPAGSEEFHSEELVYLPDGFLCYNPGEVAPATSASPFNDNGYITFGCFNNSAKINPALIELWSRILKAVPDSKLLLKFKSGGDDEVKALFIRQFEQCGISSDRIMISGWLRSPEHLKLYNQVDIALDTFPYNGTMTTLQSLLMAVPVVSLVGEHHMSRVGLSILSRLGLEFFAAATADEYVSKASALAANFESLDKIRMSMRNRLAASPLCNNRGFAIKVEQAYRTMWHKYCESRGVEMADQKSEQDRGINALKEVGSKLIEKKAGRGVVYVIWGNREKDETMLQRSIESVKKHNPGLAIHVERFTKGSKITKTRMLDFTPFEETVYLDNDTTVLGRLDYGFEKARKFGLACCINENPWARRFGDAQLSGDMVEYNAGVLFFTEKARPVFDTWTAIFPGVDCSILHYKDGKLCKMPSANQASLALAIEQTGFHPFVLPMNWNFRPTWFRSFFGPVKIWHSHSDAPDNLLAWNKVQVDEKAVIQFTEMGVS